MHIHLGEGTLHAQSPEADQQLPIQKPGTGIDFVLRHFGGPEFGRARFREAIFSIYAGDRPPVARIAELVPEVVDAAAAGDNAAARILTEAGDLRSSCSAWYVCTRAPSTCRWQYPAAYGVKTRCF